MQDLQYIVASLFNAAPELFSTLEPSRLRRVGFVPQDVVADEAS